MKPDKPLTYKDAGVDIDAGNALVDRIKQQVRSTHRAGVLGDIGGFGGLFQLDTEKYRNPVLVAGTDGVGTKLKLAIELQQYDGIGVDLVAMCVNDIIVQGAEPLFFLDYYATAQLDVATGAAIVGGIAEACRQAGMALLGGETAEMPGVYAPGDFDLAGFCVGVVERDQLIDGSAIAVGDRLLGLASSGLHSNGYSLVRRIIERQPDGLRTPWDGGSIGAALLEPTRIYVSAVRALMRQSAVHGIAHITGGGLAENLSRVLPRNVDAVISQGSWQRPDLFGWLQREGGVSDTEMLRTFNCGIGMVVVVPADQLEAAVKALNETGETAIEIGAVQSGSGITLLRE